MSREVYQTRAAPLDDDYTGDLQERPTRQRPTLTRKQAAAAWDEERRFQYYNRLMRSCTSYRITNNTEHVETPTEFMNRIDKWVSSELEKRKCQRQINHSSNDGTSL